MGEYQLGSVRQRCHHHSAAAVVPPVRRRSHGAYVTPLLSLAAPAPAPPCAADITNNWLPLWLAPNLITLIGVSALVMAYVAAAVQLPDFAGSAPLWVYAGR